MRLVCLGLEGIVATLPTAVSPVDGRTFAVKDNICTDTLPTTCAFQIPVRYFGQNCRDQLL